MRYCAKLFRELNFEPDAITPCCNVHNLTIPRFPFAGGAVDVPAYMRHLLGVLANLNGEGTLCRGCPELGELDAPVLEQDVLVKVANFRGISVNMHRHRCNCRCVYCDLWSQKSDAPYAVLPALRSLAAQNAALPGCRVSWGGGEPTILPEFEAASGWIAGQDWRQYVHTNAIVWSPVLAELLASGSARMNVSLDCGSRDIYKRVKGVDAFGVVLRNLERYARAAAKARDAGQEDDNGVTLKYIVFEKNNAIAEVERFFGICTGLGITHVQLSLNFQELNGAGPSQQTLMAAAFFMARAQALGLACVPFYVPDEYRRKIITLERRLSRGYAQTPLKNH